MAIPTTLGRFGLFMLFRNYFVNISDQIADFLDLHSTTPKSMCSMWL